MLRSNAYQPSAAEPVALALLAAAALFLLNALLRSMLSRRIALDSSRGPQQEAPSIESTISSAEPAQALHGAAPAAAAALFGLEEQDFETDEERLLADAALGKPVLEEEFRAEVRRKLASLAIVCTLQLALHVATALWFFEAHPSKDGRLPIIEASLRAAISLFSILLVFQRHRVSAWRLAVSLTAASLLALMTYFMTLVVAQDFKIFPSTTRASHGARVQRLTARSHWNSAGTASTPVFLPALFASHLEPILDFGRSHSAELARAGTIAFHAANVILAVLAFALSSTVPLAPKRVFQPLATSPTSSMLAQGQLGGDSLFIRATHLYMTPVVLLATRQGGLDATDVPYLHPELRSIALFLRFRRAWRTQRDRTADKKTTAWSLLRAMLWTSRGPILATASFGWVSAALFYVPAMSINRFVSVWERAEATGEPRDIRTGLAWAILIFVVSLTQNILMGLSVTLCWATVRSKLKQEFTTLLFSKALRRQSLGTSEKKAKKGEKDKKEEDDDDDDKDFTSKAAVMTLVSNDVERINKVGQYILSICILPFEIFVGFYYVFQLLGIGALIGLATTMLLAPVIHLIGKLNARYNDNLMKARDRRVTFLNEAIEAIRMIKFSAWEARIMDRIMLSRRRELREMRKVFFCEAAQQTTSALSPTIVIIVSILYATLVDGKKMTPSVAFTAVAVLNELRFALTELPSLIQSFVELWVSLKRMATFLDAPEVHPHEQIQPSPAPGPAEEGAVSADKATVRWPGAAESGESTFQLVDLSFSFTPGKVNLICGKVGAGKSMLLLALLGELDLHSGTIRCPRSNPAAIGGVLAPTFISPAEWIRSDLVAYVPQQAWLMNASMRDNILWGLPMETARYQDTLHACGLLPDLAILEDGDLTDIGEQGVGLSGGQKTRVSLARAVYSRAALLLMDSPLSNVDAHTAEHIREHLFEGPLLEGRTTLLVTHQLALLAPISAKIVVMDAGRVVFEGDGDSLLTSDKFSSLLEELKAEDETQEQAAAETLSESVSGPSSGTQTPDGSTPATSRAPSINGDDKKPIEEAATPIVIKEARKVIAEEARQRGTVKWNTYKAWIDAMGGYRIFGPVMFIFAVYTGWDLVSGLILKAFSADATRQTPSHPPLFWVSAYAGALTIGGLLAGIAFSVMYLASLRASERLFRDMLHAVFHATLRTLDSIPRGRILNRFSSDMENVRYAFSFRLVRSVG